MVFIALSLMAHFSGKACCAGLLALGYHNGVNSAQEGEPSDLKVAEDLMRTCYEMYRRTPTGLAPEIAFFSTRDAQRGYPSVSNTAGGGDFVIKPHVSIFHPSHALLVRPAAFVAEDQEGSVHNPSASLLTTWTAAD